MKLNGEEPRKCTIKSQTWPISVLLRRIKLNTRSSPAFEWGNTKISLATFERLGNLNLQPSGVFIKLRNAQITSVRINVCFPSESSSDQFSDIEYFMEHYSDVLAFSGPEQNALFDEFVDFMLLEEKDRIVI